MADMTEDEFRKIAEAFAAAHAPQLAAEEREVERLGDAIGYGRLMQAAEAVWRRKAVKQGTAGSEHTTGPCAAMMVKCGCREPESERRREWYSDDDMTHCDWCCGSGRVTKRVKRAMYVNS